MSSKIDLEKRWHKEKLHNDGHMRHFTDFIAWKSFDLQYPSFVANPCNVGPGLASDGFNSFENLNTSNSIWPIVLISYNLPS